MGRMGRSFYWLGELSWAGRELWTKQKNWLVFSLLAFFAVVFSGWWNVISPDDTAERVASNIVVNLTVALFAASLIDLLGIVRRLWQTQRIQREFREFFGFTDSGESVAIVLPRFSSSIENIVRKQAELWPDCDTPVAISRDYERIEYAAAPDLLATASIIEAFTRIGFRAPTVILDENAQQAGFWDEHMPGTGETSDAFRFKTYILIGLFSNRATVENEKRTPGRRYFRLVCSPGGPAESRYAIKLATYHDGHLGDQENWREYRRLKGKEDFALISKRIRPDGKTIFVIGGIDAPATQVAGRYLADKWRQFRRLTDSVTGYSPATNSFAAVVPVYEGQTAEVGNDIFLRVPEQEASDS